MPLSDQSKQEYISKMFAKCLDKMSELNKLLKVNEKDREKLVEQVREVQAMCPHEQARTIPRAIVDDKDGQVCIVCGKYL